MGRKRCCSKEGLNRGAWTGLEDQILIDYVKLHGERRWNNLPIQAGLKRCGKSCRLRWLNYLRPGIKRGNISPEEEELIIRLHKLLGNRWSLIAGRLPGRTDNEIKNYWNTNLSKRVQEVQKTAITNQKLHPQVIRTKAFRVSSDINVVVDHAQQPDNLKSSNSDIETDHNKATLTSSVENGNEVDDQLQLDRIFTNSDNLAVFGDEMDGHIALDFDIRLSELFNSEYFSAELYDINKYENNCDASDEFSLWT